MNDRFAPMRAVANAVLYEGYLLFPYTASAPKNQMRWQFGVVVPAAYEAAGTNEHADQRTEILYEALEAGRGRIEGLVRFLHVRSRAVERVRSDGTFEPVAALVAEGVRHVAFEETIEREISFELTPGAMSVVTIRYEAAEDVKSLHERGELVGRIVRAHDALGGTITVSSVPVPGELGLYWLRLDLRNESAVAAGATRAQALRTSFVSAHTLFAIEGGTFCSPIDPPERAVISTGTLENARTWPVLMGEALDGGKRSTLAFSSPIILGDFPTVAEKTDTDHFDATEVDELLTLSVLSLSDAERAEARATDPRARAIVERAEAYGADDVRAVHEGALFPDPRNRRLIEPSMPSAEDLAQLRDGDVAAYEQLPPATLIVGGKAIEKGSKVRLTPKRRADSWDMFLRGKLATVRTIHQDFEDKLYVAVTIDDDPATDLHDWYGRSFFFDPDEVEAVPETV